ncbi:lipid A deacylase LpxR family protein [Agaribacterium sp. ZY112]|uniref:lipid A deacylase LpxR family protein n=1 Tax=Agaribacterium sp. ZY112 TaxID=3233574 RepID=UPI0035238740
MSEFDDRLCRTAWYERVLLALISVFSVVLALSSSAAWALERDQGSLIDAQALAYHTPCERWSFAYENDFFVPGGRDQDYTYGMSFSYHSDDISGRMHRPLELIDSWLGLDSERSKALAYEAGLYGFTPEDTSVVEPNNDDRPYASLLYFATSSERIDKQDRKVLRSQISYGVLGLDLVGQVQNEFHRWIGNEQPQGWHNQISAGGEPTARYSVALQQLIISGSHWDLRQTKSASVGYLTEASWALGLRAGHLNSRWHQFNPDMASYAEASSRTKLGKSERFFWAGVAVKARAYNAFLQGQFKESAVSYSSSELKHMLLEAWAGYTHGFENGYYLSYGVRGHSSEVRYGAGDRAVLWGGVMLGRSYL